MKDKAKAGRCWCGSDALKVFSEHYSRCESCNTLVCRLRMPEEFYRGEDNSKSFYGKEYWTSYVKEGLGFQDIFERSRADLAERCIYWLRAILKYKLPPAATLELGCAHGGLVFLMKLAGYDASGAEMSRWICDFAEKTFAVPMLCGRIEDFSASPGTYDTIVLMDVLEHMTDPAGSVRKIAGALKDNGIIVIQTPCWREMEKTYEEMKAHQSIFIPMFQEKEHLYLFNKSSLRKLLETEGFRYIEFEPHIFPYDMFVFACRQPLKAADEEAVSAELLKRPESRVVLALMDIFEKMELKNRLLTESESDRKARFDQIQELTALAKAAQEEVRRVSGYPEVRARRILSGIFKKLLHRDKKI